jgi:hypothetical protein
MCILLENLLRWMDQTIESTSLSHERGVVSGFWNFLESYPERRKDPFPSAACPGCVVRLQVAPTQKLHPGIGV